MLFRSVRELSEFFDCILPQKNEFESSQVEYLSQQKNRDLPKFSFRRIEQSRSQKSVRGKVFFGFLGAIALLGGVLFWVSPKATIILKPRVSAVPIMQNILVTFPEAFVGKENKFLPTVEGIFTQTEVAGEETIPSSGRQYDITNAKGKITLFNETRKPKFFLPSRLQTTDGVIVRFKRDITVPARDGEQPGQLVVEVEADVRDAKDRPIGYRGNIEAGTELIFPALREESRELYYARANKGPLVGGSTLTRYLIEAGDKEKAQELLIETFRIRAIEKLISEIRNRSSREGKRYILLENPELIRTELLEYQFPDEIIGTESQTFKVYGKLKLSGVVFDQSQVVDILSRKLKSVLDPRQKLVEIDEQSTEYRVLESEDLAEEGWLKLSVTMVGVGSLDLDSDSRVAVEWRENLKKEIAGKSAEEVRSVLINMAEIDDVRDIKASPPWVKSLPMICGRIRFEVKRG